MAVPLLASTLCFAGCAGPAPQERHSGVVPTSYSLLTHLEDAEHLPAPGATIGIRAAEIDGEERAAISAHAPSSVRFPAVRLARDARLSFGVGIAGGDDGPFGDGVEFSVIIDDRGQRTELWRETVDPRRDDGRGWVDADVALADFAGRTVDLLLITDSRATALGDKAAWSHPVLWTGAPADAGGGEGTLGPVRRRVLTERLLTDETRSLTVPAAATLELTGEVVRTDSGPAPDARVTFRVRAGSDVILEHLVWPVARLTDFGKATALAGYEGERVDFDLEIDVPAALRERVDARWLQTALVREEAVARQPAGVGANLLVLLVDTLRADHLGLHGYHRDTSPELEAFGEESAIFTQAISPSSWTMPATASLLSGLQPTEHGVTDGVPLALEVETLAERVQELGMSTFAVSANPLVGRAEGFGQGHETFLHLPWARAATVNDILLRLIEEYAGSRWFGYVHYIDPHDPYAAPAPWGSTFQDDYTSPFAERAAFGELVDAVNFGIGEATASARDLEYLRSAYDGEIRYWDAQFGRLLDRLDESGRLEETIVVVTSDHGEEFLEHGRLKHGPQLYEESIRVPLLIRAPGRLTAERHTTMVETRRLLDLCLALLAPGLPDRANPVELLRPPEGLAFSHSEHGLLGPGEGRTTVTAARGGRWKLVWYPQTDRRELYDLSRDAAERENLAALDPEGLLSRYAGALRGWVETRPAPELIVEGEHQRIRERLRALGYIR